MQTTIIFFASALFCLVSASSHQTDRAIVNAAMRYKPIQVAASISVRSDSISQSFPCGMDGQMSVVVGDALTLFEDMAKQILPSFKDIVIEFNDKHVCALNDQCGQSGRPAKTPFDSLFMINMKCHHRHRFGGCEPTDYLHPDSTFNRTHPQLCKSNQAFLAMDRFSKLRKALFEPAQPYNFHSTLSYNVTQSIAEKAWQLPDGTKSAYVVATRNPEQPINVFGTLHDEFVAHETQGRFVVYMCQGTIYPQSHIYSPVRAPGAQPKHHDA